MTKEKPLKSAYELAMDRLRAEDRKKGVDEPAALTTKQKRSIADLRSKAKAKMAEIEIMHEERRAAVLGDPEALTKLEEEIRTDRRRVESRLESDVARVKRGENPETDD